MTPPTFVEPRIEAVVRVVSELYAVSAVHTLELAAGAERTTFTDERAAYAFHILAWRDVAEWFSCGWDVSEDPKLLAVWRKASVGVHMADRIADVSYVGRKKMRRDYAGLGLVAEDIDYFSSARRDLEALTAHKFRTIPGVDDMDFAHQPEGYVDFVRAEYAAVLMNGHLDSAAFEASPLGKLFVLRDGGRT